MGSLRVMHVHSIGPKITRPYAQLLQSVLRVSFAWVVCSTAAHWTSVLNTIVIREVQHASFALLAIHAMLV